MKQLSPSERVTLAIVGIAVLAGGIAPTVAPDALGTALMYDAGVLAAATFALAGTLRLSPERRGDWWFVPVATSLFFAGDVALDIYTHILHRAAPLPSSADGLRLAAYVLVMVGTVRLVRRRTDIDLLNSVFDTGMLAMAVGLLVWEPLLVDSGRSLFGALVAGTYPVADIVLVGFTAVLLGNRRLSQSTLLLFGGAGVLFIADLFLLIAQSTGRYAAGSWPDPLFVVGPFLFAAAPWFDVATDPEDATARRHRPIAGTIVVIASLVALPIDFGLIDANDGKSNELVVRMLLRILLLAFVAARLLRQAVRNESLVHDLDQQHALREGFFAMVAHEVRSPLGAIGNAAAVLRDHGEAIDTETARELAAGISTGARRLARLTGDLVDASRGGHGTFPCEMAPIADVSPIIRAAADAAAGAQRDRVHVAAAPGVSLEGDVDRVAQMVTNLVTNALKFSEGAVDVSLVRDGDQAVLSVADHGPGIPSSQQHRLFQRFTRLTVNGDGPRPSGTGLGLFITRELALAHHGSIRYLRTPGGGATFEVRLPCCG